MRKLIVEGGKKTFRVTIPDEARVTFGPWSPPGDSAKYPTSERALTGTLRIYDGQTKSKESCIAVFSDVRSYREATLQYEELVTREEGALIWKSDEKGFSREEKVSHDQAWNAPAIAAPVGEGDDED